MSRWIINSDALGELKYVVKNIINEAIEDGQIECNENKIENISYKAGEIVGFILEMELND